jgi:hypothetical protein
MRRPLAAEHTSKSRKPALCDRWYVAMLAEKVQESITGLCRSAKNPENAANITTPMGS